MRYPRLAAVMTVMIAAASHAVAAAPMVEGRFDDGWRFTRGDPAGAETATFDDAQWQPVDLPHDWSIGGPIARDNPKGSPGGFFPGGVGWYRKSFDVPATMAGKRFTIQFDGVYMLSDVWINGHKLGTKVDGFTPFEYDLTPHLEIGGSNTLAVRVDNSREPSARWYTGAGIYRHVWLDVREPMHIARFGLFVRTLELKEGEAKLALSIDAVHDGDAGNAALDYDAKIFEADAAGRSTGAAVASFAPAASAFSAVDGTRSRTSKAETTTRLLQPKLWSPETPNRYAVVVEARSAGKIVDRREVAFGVRTIAVSPDRGLEINGKPIELFGACAHDDNGPLGVAAFDRAEVRRAELLKQAGFNAVRCAHNPPAPAFLDACDRLGLLVIDESFDSWQFGKIENDYARYFLTNWKADLDAMMLRDRNHPSVIMWSLGNEIHDFGSAQALKNGTALLARARSLDSTRPMTTAVYWFRGIGGPYHWKWEEADELMSKFDVVGYNYSINRYEGDHARVPGRIIVGSESYPHDIFVAWEWSTKLPYVLGDFVCTGIDYLGESGIGRYHDPDDKIYYHLDPRHFPYHGAYCGDIDITGFRKPISHQRNIVWNRGERLYTSVTDMAPDGRTYKVVDWGIVPSRASWTWPGFEGQPVEVQVYSRCDAVRLYLNDRLIAEKPTTRDQAFKALFEVPYEPGTLRTVGVINGEGAETSVLRTAGPAVGLRLVADRRKVDADGQDLSHIVVEAVDERGDLQPNADQMVTFAVDGPATNVGVANADFGNTDPYQSNRRKLFHGRAMLVVRSGRESGKIAVRASAEGLGSATCELTSNDHVALPSDNGGNDQSSRHP